MLVQRCSTAACNDIDNIANDAAFIVVFVSIDHQVYAIICKQWGERAAHVAVAPVMPGAIGWIVKEYNFP